MRIITIPPLITLHLQTFNPQTGEPYTKEFPFERYISDNILSDKKIAGKGTIRDVERSMLMFRAFKGCTPGMHIPVPETDWKAMKDVVEAPTTGWDGFYGPQLWDYHRAILDAEEAPDPKVD